MRVMCASTLSGRGARGTTTSQSTSGRRIRVLNLDGDRAIMTVGQWDDVDHAMTEEARAVFDSITFVSGE